jgi:choline dehydrogenase-like flavoprotein
LLQSSDPSDQVRIFENYFGDPRDMVVAIKALRRVIALEQTPAFRKINARFYDEILEECAAWPANSDAYWECYIRYFTYSGNHHVGSCKMGPANDPEAVVDARLKVYGMKDLRVVDAGIIPMPVTGHTNGPVMMVAEKAADMIKEDWRVRS